jgi:GNAT superfamily N-acetyltransferase
VNDIGILLLVERPSFGFAEISTARWGWRSDALQAQHLADYIGISVSPLDLFTLRRDAVVGGINMQNKDFDCRFLPATSTDRNALHELLRACWIEIYSPHVPPVVIDRFKADDLVDRHLDAFLPCTVVAVVDGKVIGSISHDFGVVHGLFVRRDFRGNRIGSSLLSNAVIDGARVLEVAAFNKAARRFYRRCGWQMTGRSSEDVYDYRVRMFSMRFDISKSN